ncbi:MAG: hypothetical protein LLG04_00825 [Parachlamydia sp.]|nr:hypothetical protein [Parachlamydia sp.]
MPDCCAIRPSQRPCSQEPEKVKIKAPEHAKKNHAWPFWKKLEVICSVALCAFAAYANWAAFAVSFALGAGYQAVKMACKIHQAGKGEQRPGCGQGFGELLAQLPLLSPEIVLATAYVAWRHLMHDPKGFVPFVGFFVGMGAANYAATYLRDKRDLAPLKRV